MGSALTSNPSIFATLNCAFLPSMFVHHVAAVRLVIALARQTRAGAPRVFEPLKVWPQFSMKEKSVLYNPSSANLFADNVLTTGNPSNPWQLLVQSSVAGAGNFLFINMAIDMVESLLSPSTPLASMMIISLQKPHQYCFCDLLPIRWALQR